MSGHIFYHSEYCGRTHATLYSTMEDHSGYQTIDNVMDDRAYKISTFYETIKDVKATRLLILANQDVDNARYETINDVSKEQKCYQFICDVKIKMSHPGSISIDDGCHYNIIGDMRQDVNDERRLIFDKQHPNRTNSLHPDMADTDVHQDVLQNSQHKYDQRTHQIKTHPFDCEDNFEKIDHICADTSDKTENNFAPFKEKFPKHTCSNVDQTCDIDNEHIYETIDDMHINRCDRESVYRESDIKKDVFDKWVSWRTTANEQLSHLILQKAERAANLSSYKTHMKYITNCRFQRTVASQSSLTVDNYIMYGIPRVELSRRGSC